MLRIAACLSLVVALASADSAAQVAKLYPLDEAARVPEFLIFRARLVVAVQKRDTAFLYGVVSDRIKNDFGGSGGIAEFKEQWRPESADSTLCDTLGEVLAFGGKFDQAHHFFAPYWYAVEQSAGDDRSSTASSSGARQGSSRTKRDDSLEP